MREGYKKTEIGVIPLDWEVVKLGSLVNIISGQSPSNFDLTGSKYKFFKVNQLNFCEKYLTNSEYAFDKEIDNLLECGTIIFPKRGASIFTNKVRILTHKSFIDTNLMGLIVNGNLDNMFLYYLLIKFELSNIADTSSIPQINNKHIVPLKIPLPPLTQQKKIAQILSTADEKIEAIALQIEKAEMVKKGLMQRLLSDESWEKIKLEDISEFITKGSTPTTYGFNWQDEGILFLRSECVSKDGLKLEPAKYISEKAHIHLKRSEIKANDILITITGNVGRVILLDDSFVSANINQHIARIRIKDKDINIMFILQFLSQKSVRTNYLKITTGQAYPQISLKQVRETIVPFPPLKEQTQIANILTTADEKLEVLRAKKEKYEELKVGLMQKLLTGKVRV